MSACGEIVSDQMDQAFCEGTLRWIGPLSGTLIQGRRFRVCVSELLYTSVGVPCIQRVSAKRGC